MQKLNFMQEFTFAIYVECLHSNSLAKLLMPRCTRAKQHAKNENRPFKRFYWFNQAHGAHIQRQCIDIYHIFDFS